ncbi:MAG TPA: spore coat protein [Clostridia bacterium]|nr:spore coat protein [Clostridia bacterium]
MTQPLTQKERMLLEDQKKHEEICIQKYQAYAAQVQDPQLKQLLNSYAEQERRHLNTINQLLAGQVPQMNQSQQQQQPQFQNQASPGGAPFNQARQQEAALLTDLLMTEKYVSGAYDTAIFEFTCPQRRAILNHIQKEEQQHGEGLFQYMQAHGMYQPQ